MGQRFLVWTTGRSKTPDPAVVEETKFRSTEPTSDTGDSTEMDGRRNTKENAGGDGRG